MIDYQLVNLLAFYGIFLIVCGIVSVIFIGKKAKTALLSGGSSGLLALLISWMLYQQAKWAVYAGLGLSFILTLVFAWRATSTFLTLLDKLIVNDKEGLTSKGIAFLIISTMFTVSMIALILQLIYYQNM